MALAERELAEWLMADKGQTYVDSMNGETLGGMTLSELHMQHCLKMGRPITDIDVESMAIRHWVSSAGYDKDGKFVYVLSNTIQNC